MNPPCSQEKIFFRHCPSPRTGTQLVLLREELGERNIRNLFIIISSLRGAFFAHLPHVDAVLKSSTQILPYFGIHLFRMTSWSTTFFTNFVHLDLFYNCFCPPKTFHIISGRHLKVNFAKYDPKQINIQKHKTTLFLLGLYFN